MSISNAKKALKARDVEALCAALAALMLDDSIGWRRKLASDSFLPAPWQETAQTDIATLLEAGKHLAHDRQVDQKHLQEFTNVCLSSLVLIDYFNSIIKRKQTLAYYQLEVAARMMVACSFLESQLLYVDQRAAMINKDDGHFDPHRLSESSISLAHSRGSVGLVSAAESQCECAELLLREALHDARAVGFGSPETSYEAYENEDFEKVLYLAGAWRKCKELWTELVYCGWHCEVREGARVFIPGDEEAFISRATSIIRSDRIQHEWTANVMWKVMAEATDTPELIAEIGRGLDLPAAPEVWRGELDRARFFEACRKPGGVFGLS